MKGNRHRTGGGTDSNIFLPPFSVYGSKVFWCFGLHWKSEKEKRKGLHYIIRCPVMLCYNGLIFSWGGSGIGMGAVVAGMESLAVNEGAALCWRQERAAYGRRRSFLLLQQNTTTWWLQITCLFPYSSGGQNSKMSFARWQGSCQ